MKRAQSTSIVQMSYLVIIVQTRCGGNNKGLKVGLENECLEDEFSGFLF